MSGLPPLPGHPGAVRLLADRLASTAQRLSALAAVLARLRDGATWDGPAGEAFGARLREVGPVLDAVVGAARRGRRAAARRSPTRWRRPRRSWPRPCSTSTRPSTRMPCSRTARPRSCGAGAGEGVSRAAGRAPPAGRAGRGAAGGAGPPRAAAAERFREADARCAAVLRTLRVDGIADSLPYRVLAGVSSAGHDVATLGTCSRPWCPS